MSFPLAHTAAAPRHALSLSHRTLHATHVMYRRPSLEDVQRQYAILHWNGLTKPWSDNEAYLGHLWRRVYQQSGLHRLQQQQQNRVPIKIRV